MRVDGVPKNIKHAQVVFTNTNCYSGTTLNGLGSNQGLLILIPDPVHVGLVEDKLAVRQASLPTTSVSPVSILPPLLIFQQWGIILAHNNCYSTSTFIHISRTD